MSAAARTATSGAWRRQGEVWLVGLGGRETPLRDSKGLHHLANLLSRPDEPVRALELVAAVEGHGAGAGSVEPELSVGRPGDAGAVLDAEAKAQYRARLAEAQDELDQAQRFNDPERAARARLEVEFIARELSAAVGLGGRDRRAASASERARVNVTRSIKAAVDRIAGQDDGLALHLRGTVRTGTHCVYAPPAGERVLWDFGLGTAAEPPPSPRVQRAPRPEVTAATDGPPAAALCEREAELALFEHALAAAAEGAGSAILVTGPAGIGKSALLSAAADRAGQRGFDVLRAYASELDGTVPFGVVRQLFEPALRALHAQRRTQLLHGAVTPAAVMLGYGEPRDKAERREPSAFDVNNALYWLCSALADEAPLALIVDDAHWADEQSLAWLQHLAVRIGDMSVLLAVGDRATRGGVSGELSAGVQVLAPAALSRDGVAELVQAGYPAASPDFIAAVHASSGGNPFFVREIVAAARSAGIEPTREGAAGLADVTPESVTLLVRSRLRRLGDEAGALARACAVLGSRAELTVAAALAELDGDAGLRAADVLAEAGILRAGRPLEFSHPLIRAVVDQEIPLGARARLHERAAGLLEELRAPVSELAGHLLQARPAAGAKVVETLRAAARQALAESAPDTAARFLERAVVEPPGQAELPAVLLELARTFPRAGRAGEAGRHLRSALGMTSEPALRAQIVLELTRLPAGGALGARLAALDEAIAALGDADRELRFQLEAQAIELLGDAIVVTASPHIKRQHDERLERIAGTADGGTAGERQLLAIYAVQKAVAGDIAADEARSLAMRALDDGVLMRRLADGVWSCDSAVETLSLVDAFDLADRCAREAERHARERGSPAGEGYACMLRAMVALHRGNLLELEALLRSVFAILAQAPDSYVQCGSLQMTVCGAIERGDLDAAERACEELSRSGYAPMGTPHALGLLHGVRGEHELAVGELRASFEMQRSAGVWRRTFMRAIGPDLVMGLAALGESDEALAVGREELALARRFGAPSAVGHAQRALAHVDPENEGIAHLTEASRVLAGGQALLLRAHVLSDLGILQRRADDMAGARESLRSALQLAERSGARTLEERVRDQLALAGVRARPSAPAGAELLSPEERRVALLAAEGAPDRGIAQALFMSPRDVEAALDTAFTKLGVVSRAELAAALGVSMMAA